MKAIKSFTLTTALLKQLNKEPNASNLVEGLLKKHYGNFDGEGGCIHKWTPPSSIPAGLCKECIWCGKTEMIHIETCAEERERKIRELKTE